MSENTENTEGASASTGTINIVLNHGGVQVGVEVPEGTDLGHIRSLSEDLDEIGAPSNYNLGVNGTGQDDDRVLLEGDIVSFRPVSGNKGALMAFCFLACKLGGQEL